ncbi:hypothetical protein CEXT_443101 [Caerostris extrusa]|uniref:Uncharacterized protein n=1 Tax=Caerostris extrusa TaxID=172846 RepID=A0AAV4NNP7_CAEEX|nr:hypothetical protein CEXT_443101 [Caerostris extrusa]
MREFHPNNALCASLIQRSVITGCLTTLNKGLIGLKYSCRFENTLTSPPTLLGIIKNPVHFGNGRCSQRMTISRMLLGRNAFLTIFYFQDSASENWVDGFLS